MHILRLDRVVDVLRNVAGLARNRLGVELGRDHADHIAVHRDERAARVTGLDRRADLEHARVVVGTGKTVDDAVGDFRLNALLADIGKTHRHNRRAAPHLARCAQRQRFETHAIAHLGLEQGQVIGAVHRNCARLEGLALEVAQGDPAAVDHHMKAGDEVAISRNEKTGAGGGALRPCRRGGKQCQAAQRPCCACHRTDAQQARQRGSSRQKSGICGGAWESAWRAHRAAAYFSPSTSCMSNKPVCLPCKKRQARRLPCA